MVLAESHCGGSADFQQAGVSAVGAFGRILLTLPNFCPGLAAQGISLLRKEETSQPLGAGVETSFQRFVTNVVVARLTPVLAAILCVEAALDAAEGYSPLGSSSPPFFLLSGIGHGALNAELEQRLGIRDTDMLTSAGISGRHDPARGIGVAVVERSSITRGTGHHALDWIRAGISSVSAIWKLSGHGRLMKTRS